MYVARQGPSAVDCQPCPGRTVREAISACFDAARFDNNDHIDGETCRKSARLPNLIRDDQSETFLRGPRWRVHCRK